MKKEETKKEYGRNSYGNMKIKKQAKRASEKKLSIRKDKILVFCIVKK